MKGKTKSAFDHETYEYGHDTLSDQEVDMVVIALARGQDTFTENEATKAIAWAAETKINSALLELVEKGYARIQFLDGEIAFTGTTPNSRTTPATSDSAGDTARKEG